MFSFFRHKRSIAHPDLSAVTADMHSHLLPGIDDGSPDTDTSLQLIKGLQELGLRHFITTPHILWDLYRNDNETISQAQHKLEAASDSRGLSLSLSAAAEYLIDDHFTSCLKNKEKFRTLAGKYILVEFSFVSLPYNWKQVFFDLQIQGYKPILAHPERYGFLSAQPAIFQEISDMGVYLQVNLNSLTGYYGKQALHLAHHLLKNKLISFVGTDLHHQRHLEAIRNSSSLMTLLQPLIDSGRLLNPTLL
jgi:protein-tyrosine phosphatase